METPRHPIAQWLDAATAGILFRPDRTEVRAELEAHLEDKALDFQRIFPDLTNEEAQQRALAEMGDPGEIGRELAKIHRPWLGYLWRCSQILTGVLLTALLLFGPHWGIFFDWLSGYRPVSTANEAWTEGIPFSGVESLSVGPYTLQVTGRLNLEQGEEGSGTLYLTWHTVSPLFWEEPAYSGLWQGEDSLGNFYPSAADARLGVSGSQRRQEVFWLSWERAGLGWRGISYVAQVPGDVQWVQLTLDVGEETISLRLEREEERP